MTQMTVGKLKEILENFDDELPVHISHGSGDYWHTKLARPVSEHGYNEEEVQWSEYHQTYQLDGSDEDERNHMAFVLGD